MHLQVDNVSKRFGSGSASKLVLENISFDLHAGEFLALVGSSGSGKSTVMRLIAGLDRPSAGVISIDGVPDQGAAGFADRQRQADIALGAADIDLRFDGLGIRPRLDVQTLGEGPFASARR
jgi:ABC-type dipeptide/oligopeptide/nickel transport system ATPase subunit